MKKFFKDLLSENNEVSHKRVIALLSFAAILILAFLSAFGHTADQMVLSILAVLAGGESLLTVIEKFRKV